VTKASDLYLRIFGDTQMRISAKLYFEPPIAVGRDLIAFDDRQIQNRHFPILSVGAADLNIAVNIADSRDTVRDSGDIVVVVVSEDTDA
jgi:hypothetical protein